MGNVGLANASQKDLQSMNSLQNEIKIKVIPYKMDDPNPTKFSNCILKLLYDSDFIPRSSILFLLEYGKVKVGSLQNGLWNGLWDPSN